MKRATIPLIVMGLTLLTASSCTLNELPASTPMSTQVPSATLTSTTVSPTTTPSLPTALPSIIGPELPNTSEARAIIKVIERAYDIELEAAYYLELRDFSEVFINDPRYPLPPAGLETVRELTHNPELESAGYLDYKMAFWGWRISATRHWITLLTTAESEHRDLTVEERASLIDDTGRSAPAPLSFPVQRIQISFISLELNDDVAIAEFEKGFARVELTLVRIQGQWYIAAFRYLVISP